MDSTMSLFGTEFSLFGEDLLFSPTAPIDEGVVTAPQDGLKVTTLSVTASDWQTAEPNHGQDVLSVKQASGDLLEDWLDTRVDLFNIIDEQNAQPSSESLMDLGFGIPVEDQTGLLALKIEAEKTTLELSTKALEQPKVVQDLPSQGSDNVYDQGLGLLELLTAGNASQKQATWVNDLVGLDLAPPSVDTSEPILSPMSPEDVETILSSGPTSPESLVAEESFESLMSSVLGSDNSFADMEIAQVEDTKPSVDLALLSELLIAGNDVTAMQSDSDMENYPTKSSQRGGRGRTKVKKENTLEAVLHKTQDRKLRKKQQNKDAATRYRQKKKAEQDLINREVSQLEERNTELKDKVDQMTREIRYLKSLLSDVYKARANPKKSK